MKKLLILLAAFALSTGVASAQTDDLSTAGGTARGGMGRGMQRSPEQMAEARAKQLTTQLGLNADQTEKVRQLTLTQAQQMQEKRASAMASGDRTTMRNDMQAAREQYETQLKGILTPEQYTKYATMREDRMEGRKEGKAKMKDDKVKLKS
ncbi:hypothetical protein [Hymenobacter crusticola]|uniref:DUF4890 domain-containing protein n=1 Tax=Hymenobacter crusticola TaxID=1770526 RepID=A0A243WAQ7_9BACT|nr:hypothetical protein [Hymenobacter crusticola]OUJ72460.1 hypothetical protein BXP70_18025 [Hymenobacter crusticola]